MPCPAFGLRALKAIGVLGRAGFDNGKIVDWALRIQADSVVR